MGLKSFTKAESKTLRDLGVARADFLWLDEQIATHQLQTDLTRIFPNTEIYKTAGIEFTKAPFNYIVNMTDTTPGKAIVNFIDWNV